MQEMIMQPEEAAKACVRNSGWGWIVSYHTAGSISRTGADYFKRRSRYALQLQIGGFPFNGEEVRLGSWAFRLPVL